MKSSVVQTLFLAGALATASAAMAATPAVHHRAHPAEAAKAALRRVITEAPNRDPSLTDIFAASDGAFYTPVTHDPRSHGLPEY